VCSDRKFKIAEVAEQLEPGTPAFRLLQDCLEALSWEMDL